MAEQRRWVAAFVEAGDARPFRTLAAGALTASLRVASWRHRSSARLRRALGVFKSFSLQGSPDGSLAVGIDVDRVAGRADSGNLELDLCELMTDLGEAAADLGTGVLLAVDELQALARSDIAAILAAAHQASRQRLPVAIAGAGLPNLPGLLMDVKTYSERLFSYRRIGTLGPGDAAEALERPAETLGVSWQPAAVDRGGRGLRRLSLLPPTLRQVDLGLRPRTGHHRCRDAAVGVIWARRDLNANFYGNPLAAGHARAARLPVSDGGEAGDADAAVSTGRIAARLDKSHSGLGPCRDQLIRKGLVYAPGRGLVAFTVPGMGAFVNSLSN